MVRMCTFTTFALATAMVAGGALGAAKPVKAVKPVSAGPVSAVPANPESPSGVPSWVKAPMSLRAINNVTGGAFGALAAGDPLPPCVCAQKDSSGKPLALAWDNGNFANDANSDGVASHLGGAYEHGIQAADDFFLCEGFVYKLNSITAQVVTNSLQGNTTKAKLEIYRDCNGCPKGDPICVLDAFDKDDSGGTYMMNPAFRIVTYTFKVAGGNGYGGTSTHQQTDPNCRSIYLHGGVYWVSIIGLTDGLGCTMQMYDSTYWPSTNVGVKGSVPKKRLGVVGATCDNCYTFRDCCDSSGCCGNCWAPVDDCCFGCKDLNFQVCADACKILVDNGGAAGDPASDPSGTAHGSPSQFVAPGGDITVNSRSADDFVVPPCNTFCVCYIEGCIFTNCPVDCTTVTKCGIAVKTCTPRFQGAYELYLNDCRCPEFNFGDTPKCSGKATKAIDLGFDYVVGTGATQKKYRAYRLEFHNITDCCLDGGAQYWISLGAKFTYSLNEKTFFCCNADCRRSCLQRWNPGKYLAPQAQPDPVTNCSWVDAGCDFSFLIAGTLTPTTAGQATGTCAADFNGDGNATVQDLFDFLSAWFAGCH